MKDDFCEKLHTYLFLFFDDLQKCPHSALSQRLRYLDDLYRELRISDTIELNFIFGLLRICNGRFSNKYNLELFLGRNVQNLLRR